LEYVPCRLIARPETKDVERSSAERITLRIMICVVGKAKRKRQEIVLDSKPVERSRWGQPYANTQTRGVGGGGGGSKGTREAALYFHKGRIIVDKATMVSDGFCSTKGSPRGRKPPGQWGRGQIRPNISLISERLHCVGFAPLNCGACQRCFLSNTMLLVQYILGDVETLSTLAFGLQKCKTVLDAL
jgi:hypothetical protein